MQTATKKPLTSNQFYGRVNARFEKRAAFLHSQGFKYECVKDYGIAVFVRRHCWKKTKTIAASCVLYASNRVWADITATIAD